MFSRVIKLGNTMTNKERWESIRQVIRSGNNFTPADRASVGHLLMYIKDLEESLSNMVKFATKSDIKKANELLK